jgi:hypothetical protein
MANDPEMEALIQALSEMGVMPGYQGRLDQQMQVANELRKTPMPQGREVSNGRVFVASSPLENIAAALKQYQGQNDLARLHGQVPEWAGSQGGLLAREQQARQGVLRGQVNQYQALIDALRNRNQQQPYRPGTYDVPGPGDIE